MQRPGARQLAALVLVAPLLLVARSAASASVPGLGNLDPRCNDGHGFHLTIARGELDNFEMTETTNDVSIVEYDGVNPAGTAGVERLTFVAVGPDCRLDRGVGTDGVLRPHVPGFVRCAPCGPSGVALAPGRDGTFFMLTSGPKQWLLGEFTPRGALDLAFGHRGWVSLLPPGAQAGFSPSIADLEVEPDGTILVVGSDARPHADVLSYLYELAPTGAVDRGFGDDGHVRVLPPVAYASEVLVQPDGSIAVVGSLGGGGCFVLPIEWLDADGHPEAWVDANYARGGTFPLQDGFLGQGFPDAYGGVGIIGASSPCGRSGSRGFDAAEALGPNGVVEPGFGDDGSTRFTLPDPSSWDLFATTLPGGTVVLESYDDPGPWAYLQAFSANGLPILAFGHRDTVALHYAPGPVAWASPTPIFAGPRDDVVVGLPSDRGFTIEERVA